MSRPINFNNLYHNGSANDDGTGKLAACWRQVNMNGDHNLVALLQVIKDIATADGTIANVVTHADGLLTEFATPATFTKVVEEFY